MKLKTTLSMQSSGATIGSEVVAGFREWSLAGAWLSVGLECKQDGLTVGLSSFEASTRDLERI